MLHSTRKNTLVASIAILTFLTSCASLLAQEYSQYGGWTAIKGTATGFFHTQKIDGKWWLIDPEGNVFFSKGVNSIDYQGDFEPSSETNPYGVSTTAKYGSAQAWAAAATSRLKSFGFNTIGSWSSPETWTQNMPYTVILSFGTLLGANWQERVFFDVFDPQFAPLADARALERCAPLKDDPWLIGYYTDNELAWAVGADALKHVGLFYLELPAGSPGKDRMIAFLKERYPTIESLNNAWGTTFASYEFLEQNETELTVTGTTFETDHEAFLRLVAERYFEVCHAAIRKADPNHLILGCRFAWPNERIYPVIEEMVGKVDVLTVNNYQLNPFVSTFEEYTARTDLPIMVTEFAFRGADTGHPNTIGAGPVQNSQERRTKSYVDYVVAITKSPVVVGYHWFQHEDQPYGGRFDGEDSNYGIVTLQDEPYALLSHAATQINPQLENLHIGQSGIILNPWQRNFDSAGNPVTTESLKGTIQFSFAQGTVAWTATTADNWITITGNTSGSNTGGNTRYTVAPNYTGAPRTGTIYINDQPFYVHQAPGSIFAPPWSADLGSGWKWNALGYLYDGYFPFIYSWSMQQFYYIFTPASEEGYYLYDFTRAKFGYTGYPFYPNYFTLDGSNEPFNLNPQ